MRQKKTRLFSRENMGLQLRATLDNTAFGRTFLAYKIKCSL